MSSLTLTAYVLVWPVIAMIVLAILIVGVGRDMRHASKTNDSLV